jgi:hypothetical protein
LWANLKGVELANPTCDTVAEVLVAAQQGIARSVGNPRCCSPFSGIATWVYEIACQPIERSSFLSAGFQGLPSFQVPSGLNAGLCLGYGGNAIRPRAKVIVHGATRGKSTAPRFAFQAIACGFWPRHALRRPLVISRSTSSASILKMRGDSGYTAGCRHEVVAAPKPYRR